jgi:hypothetical protein
MAFRIKTLCVSSSAHTHFQATSERRFKLRCWAETHFQNLLLSFFRLLAGVVVLGQESYSVAVKVYSLYGAFFNEVAKELGEKKALALHERVHDRMGAETGRKLREEMGIIKYDLKALAEILRKSNVGIGIDSQLVEGPSSLLLRNARCPMYDGYRMGGLSDEAAEALCQVGAPAKLGSTLKELNPNVSYRLTRYRQKPTERCEEEIRLE